MLCHGAWSPASLSTHRVGMDSISNLDTHLCLLHSSSSVDVTAKSEVWRSGLITNGMRSDSTTPQDCTFIPDTSTHPLGMPPLSTKSDLTASTPVLDVTAIFCTNGVWPCPTLACECGAEEQTVNLVVLKCPISQPPHGQHRLTVLDDGTIEWLLNTCPEI